MESERYPGGQVHRGDRVAEELLGGEEVLGGEDHHVRSAKVGVVHKRQDVAVVFACVLGGRGEDGLPTVASRPNSRACAVPATRSWRRIALANASSENSPDTVIDRLTSPITAL